LTEVVDVRKSVKPRKTAEKKMKVARGHTNGRRLESGVSAVRVGDRSSVHLRKSRFEDVTECCCHAFGSSEMAIERCTSTSGPATA
jgi:hypothetical protein